jgi:phage tail sheath protein FI
LAYPHGVYKYEVPTSLVPPVRTEAGLPVFVGTAPVHLGSDPEALLNVNKTQLVYSYAEAVELFGFSRDWEKYTLCEAIYSQFALFGVAPCVLINILDPAVHKTDAAAAEYAVTDGAVNLGLDVLLDTVVFSGESPAAGTDYSLGYDKDGSAIVTLLPGGSLAEAASVNLSFSRLNPGAVDEYDIIGGVNSATGGYEGLELVNQVFPKFRLVPGLLASPKWSQKPAVAAVMRAKMDNINGHFTGMSVADIPSDAAGADRYTEAPAWKNQNNYVAERQIVCWPKVKLGDDVFHLSTQLIGLMNKTDAGNEDIPYESPSNKALQMNAAVDALGKEIDLGPEQANYLNGQGIVTSLNWIGGHRAWGNRTGAYPAVTDPKDAFIPIRRMMDWIGNEFILTFWQKTDKPMSKRLIKTIVNSFNVRLNGLAARGYILGGRVEFLGTENAITDLMDGILRFHIYVTPPSPAEQIVGILEFDPQYLSVLFKAVA